MKKLIFLLITQLALISVINGQSFDSVRKDAESGNSIAEYDLSVMYLKGIGTTQNLYKAFFWMKKSAEQGDGPAQFYLGNMYFKGEGVLADATKAIYWYKKSAEQGNSNAQYNLGVLYYYAMGVQKNLKQSAYWMRKASNNGFEPAKEMWNKLELWKYADTAKGKSTSNKVCSSIKPYGDVSICLPVENGMTECYSNQNIKNMVGEIYSSNNFNFFGVYIDNSTYKKGLSTSLNNEFIFIFSPRELIGVPINQNYIDNLSSKLGNEINVDWKKIALKVEKFHNYTFKTEKPLLLSDYKPYNRCFSKIVLTQKSFPDNYFVLVEIENMVEIKHRLVVVLYGIRFNGEASIKEAKAKNDLFVLKLINAN